MQIVIGPKRLNTAMKIRKVLIPATEQVDSHTVRTFSSFRLVIDRLELRLIHLL